MTNEKWVKTSIANMKVGDVVRKAERYRKKSAMFPGYDGRQVTVKGFCNEMWEGFSIEEDFGIGDLYYCRVEQADDEWEKLVIEEEVQEWIDGLVTEIDNLEVETGKKESYLYDAYTYLYKENDKNVVETVTISIDKEYAEKIIEAVRVMESYGATMLPVFNDLYDLIKNGAERE